MNKNQKNGSNMLYLSLNVFTWRLAKYNYEIIYGRAYSEKEFLSDRII